MTVAGRNMDETSKHYLNSCYYELLYMTTEAIFL